jgi:hypothetical protein
VLEIAREGICRHNVGKEFLESRASSKGRVSKNISRSAEYPLSWIFYDLACAALKGVLV